MIKPICIGNGLQPVEEFLSTILRRLLDLGYKQPSARSILDWDSEGAKYSATFEIDFFKPTLTNLRTMEDDGPVTMPGEDIQVRATQTVISADPDDALKTLMKDALTWIEQKEKA